MCVGERFPVLDHPLAMGACDSNVGHLQAFGTNQEVELVVELLVEPVVDLVVELVVELVVDVVVDLVELVVELAVELLVDNHFVLINAGCTAPPGASANDGCLC